MEKNKKKVDCSFNFFQDVRLESARSPPRAKQKKREEKKKSKSALQLTHESHYPQ